MKKRQFIFEVPGGYGIVNGMDNETGEDIVTHEAVPASLLVAAPDLLAALEAIIGHEKHLLNQYRVADAIAAIAKAKGE